MLYLTIIAAAGIVALAYVLGRIMHKPRSDAFLPGLPVPVPTSFSFQRHTHGGVGVNANVDVPAAAMDLIDEGIQIQIDRATATHPDWAAGSKLSDYAVVFIAPMATNAETDPGSPALLVGSGLGAVQAAGTCIGTEPGGTPVIVLPEQQAAGWSYAEYLKQSARNESEHCRLALNDREMFDYYQGANDTHPIFP